MGVHPLRADNVLVALAPAAVLLDLVRTHGAHQAEAHACSASALAPRARTIAITMPRRADRSPRRTAPTVDRLSRDPGGSARAGRYRAPSAGRAARAGSLRRYEPGWRPPPAAYAAVRARAVRGGASLVLQQRLVISESAGVVRFAAAACTRGRVGSPRVLCPLRRLLLATPPAGLLSFRRSGRRVGRARRLRWRLRSREDWTPGGSECP
jgi:hypothetical protein